MCKAISLNTLEFIFAITNSVCMYWVVLYNHTLLCYKNIIFQKRRSWYFTTIHKTWSSSSFATKINWMRKCFFTVYVYCLHNAVMASFFPTLLNVGHGVLLNKVLTISRYSVYFITCTDNHLILATYTLLILINAYWSYFFDMYKMNTKQRLLILVVWL